MEPYLSPFFPLLSCQPSLSVGLCFLEQHLLCHLLSVTANGQLHQLTLVALPFPTQHGSLGGATGRAGGGGEGAGKEISKVRVV